MFYYRINNVKQSDTKNDSETECVLDLFGLFEEAERDSLTRVEFAKYLYCKVE